jgi:chromosome segregation ATPase
MSDQPNLYTLAEASQLTGLSTEALRLRIKRGKLAADKGNDGHPRVRLTSADLEDFRRQFDQHKPTLTRQYGNKANAIKVLGSGVDALREQLERERERERDAARLAVAKAEGESATLREQVESERGRAERAERERDAARAEREAAKVAAAAAEGRAEGLRLALEEARRPFWRRWLDR